MFRKQGSKGFTLIELLIVVAIIAILAAIAIPNFMAAQTRSKVSRAKAEMRTLATALETYCVDNSSYPPGFVYQSGYGFGWQTPDGCSPYLYRLIPLTTPMAYITSIPMDIFSPGRDRASGRGWSDNNMGAYDYYTSFPDDIWIIYGSTSYPSPSWADNNSARWRLASYGPARRRFFSTGDFLKEGQIGNPLWEYDPTNGVVSNGMITRVGP